MSIATVVILLTLISSTLVSIAQASEQWRRDDGNERLWVCTDSKNIRNLFGQDVCIPTGTTRPVKGLPANLPPDILDRLHQNDRFGIFDKN